MKKSRVVAAALIGIAFVSLVGFTSAQTSRSPGKYQTGVFAKVYGYGAWIDLTTEYQTLLSLSLPNVAISAYYYVVCDGYAYMDEAEVEIAMGVDSPTEDASTRRFYHSEAIADDPNGIHTERLYYLGPGRHTFYFLGMIYEGLGIARVNYHTITVIVFTDGSLTELAATAGVGAPDGA